MKDRFLPGLIGGALAGIVMDLLNAVAYYWLHASTLRNLDFTAIILYGHLPRSPVETLLAEVWHVVWTSLLGIAYVYGVRLTPTAHRHVRGAAYGVVVWLFIYATTLLFKVPYVRIIAWNTTLSSFLLAIVFGVVLSYVVGRLLARAETHV